ncbi:hypothetical protein PSM7751_01318 [Pseudooceanicola marinus]|uniref:Uncharacterized protein n=1 Tax=Pseudooceanicola marinus TaxID=396013 RepID=A0A1X6YTA7_9RHOB|nr:hypothetical protein PSM7751_01318 [Pseudooceanicola marinus]
MAGAGHRDDAERALRLVFRRTRAERLLPVALASLVVLLRNTATWS